MSLPLILNSFGLFFLRLLFFRLRSADRAEQFPQIQGADMSSFGAADTVFLRIIAYGAHFHASDYTLSKSSSSIKYRLLVI